jgi:hypothetical protein
MHDTWGGGGFNTLALRRLIVRASNWLFFVTLVCRNGCLLACRIVSVMLISLLLDGPIHRFLGSTVSQTGNRTTLPRTLRGPSSLFGTSWTAPTPRRHRWAVSSLFW